MTESKASPSEDKKLQTIILSRLPEGTTIGQIEALLNENKFAFKEVEMMSKVDANKIVGTLNKREAQKALEEKDAGEQAAKITFQTRDDLTKVAHCIIFDRILKLGSKKLHMLLHKQHGDYNPKTSVYIGLINPFCREQDIVEELNLILRDDRVKKEKEKEVVVKNFIVSCCVFFDPVTSRPKQFAFVDFNSEEAAQLCIKTWNNKSMKKFPNRLIVTSFDAQHQKMSKDEREKTKERGNFTNLWVEKLPYAFQDKDVYDLFSQYGTVSSVKVKKPQSNVRLQSINSLPCSAYVNFANEEHAKVALESLNGKQILPGSNSLRIEYYQRANKFLGGFMGLSRDELIQNTHFRVLFIKGLYKSVTREQLISECEKFGYVDTLTLKTKVEDGVVKSRGIAIVQFQEKAAAADALKKLPFVSSLGEMLDVDFYQSKESRMQELEIRNNPFQQVLNQTVLRTMRALSNSRSLSPFKNRPSRGKRTRNNHTNQKANKGNRQKSSTKNVKTSRSKSRPASTAAQPKQYRQKQPAPASQGIQSAELASKSHKASKQQSNNKSSLKAKDSNASSASALKPQSQDASLKQKKAKKANAQSMQQLQGVQRLPNGMPMPVPLSSMPPPPVQTNEPLIMINKQEFSNIQNEQEQKQYLGNYLYQFVLRNQKEEAVAGKVTGMILDGQTVEYILHLCSDKKAFYQLVEEAVKLIRQAQ